MVDVETSLRARSKVKRRVAIQRAAMRLFAERGYDRTTIADIAGAAELAPRTVSTYFPNKLDIALSSSDDMARRLVALLRTNAGLTFTELLDRWLEAEIESADPDLAALTSAMFEANPALRAVSTAHLAEATSVATSLFLAEIGLPAGHPMTRIAGAAVGGAVSEYVIVAASRGTADQHESFVTYLRAIIAAARR